ncbi:MAG: hypothetical protein FJ109_19020 [Deltaproteobacteria bacterium]|nr:hypothetical protein [Deltaproteobacteria bacterium]
MDGERLLQIVLAATSERDGRRILPCETAFRLADEHGVDLKDIARVCNANDIKFVQCQLGCFK